MLNSLFVCADNVYPDTPLITTTKTVDASVALVKTEDAGGQTTYELRPNGQPSSVMAQGGVLTTFGYDEFGRRTSIDDPSAGIRTYTDNYNPDGTRIQMETDAAGNTITTTGDIYGRVIRVERPEFNTDYSYDPDGRLISEISTNGVRQMYFYDEFDRLQGEEKNVDDLSFAKSYTYADRLLKRKDIVTYSYMFSPSMFSEEYIYQNGNITQMPNGGTLSYDDEDRPYQVTSLTPLAASPPASDQTVSYTSFLRPSTIAQDGLECSFDYDAGGARVKMSFSLTDSDRGDNITYYLDEYEYHGSSGRRILYLGGDAYSAPAVLVRTSMSTGWSLYYICRDYLGSITHVAYSSGELKQELSYDA